MQGRVEMVVRIVTNVLDWEILDVTDQNLKMLVKGLVDGNLLLEERGRFKIPQSLLLRYYQQPICYYFI